jgi:hypothetical protein
LARPKLKMSRNRQPGPAPRWPDRTRPTTDMPQMPPPRPAMPPSIRPDGSAARPAPSAARFPARSAAAAPGTICVAKPSARWLARSAGPWATCSTGWPRPRGRWAGGRAPLRRRHGPNARRAAGPPSNCARPPRPRPSTSRKSWPHASVCCVISVALGKQPFQDGRSRPGGAQGSVRLDRTASSAAGRGGAAPPGVAPADQRQAG